MLIFLCKFYRSISSFRSKFFIIHLLYKLKFLDTRLNIIIHIKFELFRIMKAINTCTRANDFFELINMDILVTTKGHPNYIFSSILPIHIITIFCGVKLQ